PHSSRRRLFHTFQLISEGACIINFAQCLSYGGGIDRDRARLFVGENTVEHERLNVAVENDADKFIGFVYHWTAAVPANDVGVGNEIEFCREIEVGLLIDPTLGKVERRLVVVLGGALI